MNRILKVSDFSKTPGPRYISEGKYSGQLFRQELLYPEIRKAIHDRIKLTVDLDRTAGYGTSFLKEAFGGLVKNDHLTMQEVLDTLEFKTEEEEYLRDDIVEYIKEVYNE